MPIGWNHRDTEGHRSFDWRATRPMHLVAHSIDFGIDEEEPLAYVWCRDVERDFVFSLTRELADAGDSPIQVMVRDQLWASVDDLRCIVDRNTIRSEVPEPLREYTEGSDELVVAHGCEDRKFDRLVTVLERVFDGKRGLTVDLPPL